MTASLAASSEHVVPDLAPYWMPYTHNRLFKRQPRLLVSAEGMYYTTVDGRRVIDGLSGLWCSNAGHRHPRIVEAVKKQLDTLDYAAAFQMNHPRAFELAGRIVEVAPAGFDHVFFVNSGSEACDTALKIALAWHRVRGEGTRTRFVGREKGYHGVGFGGMSVGGIGANRKAFGVMLPGVDHLPHTHEPERMAFTRGQPTWGAHLAGELERLVALHDASNIAAVMVEPLQGSAGVIVPPVGYLERLREICDRHGILLIFDEVITGFGRLGDSFGASSFGVLPDIITFAKGVTSGVVPLGGVLVRRDIYDAFMHGPEHAIELLHGYTYSGHPLACAAGIAALDVYAHEDLFDRARAMAPVLEDAIHSLRGEPGVTDIRNLGMAAAVDLEPLPGRPTVRAMNVFHWCFDHGVVVRYTGDTIAIGPPLIAGEEELGQIVDLLRQGIRHAARS